jgi:hypothetical protein
VRKDVRLSIIHHSVTLLESQQIPRNKLFADPKLTGGNPIKVRINSQLIQIKLPTFGIMS